MEMITDETERQARKAFSAQKRTAKQRGIPFLFTFEGWWAWWQTDSRWANRGMGWDKFVMARKGDTGPYSAENVYCATHAQNRADIPPGVMSENVRKGWQTKPKAVAKGAQHCKSKPVRTPDGTFVNATEAAAHYGLTRQGAKYRADVGKDGWEYINDAA